MAGFNGTVLTTKGRNLQAKAQIGTALNFTKVKLGSGTLANGQSLESLNDLIAPVMTLTIQGMTTNSDGTSKITVLVTNNGLETGFYVREIGLYATDPQFGEILYSVSNAGTLADYLPAGGGAVVVEQLFELITVVGNATNVTAVIDTSLVLATKDDVITHNTSAIAHADLLHIWQSTKAYIKGDICFPSGPSYPSWMILECTTAGTSAATEPTWGSTVGAEIADNTAAWRVKNMISGSGVSIGTVMPHLATTAPAGWLALDTGALVSRTTYAELWTWVQAKAPLISESAWQAQAATQSSVGAYSSGDGSTTFRLPRIVDYVRGGLTADVGTWQGDAIRNITGTIGGNLTPTGAFSIKNVNASLGTGSSGNNYTFDASTQVPTAEENRPKTIKMLYCVKAFDAFTNQGLIDITALANEMAGKVNSSDFTGVNQSKTANGWQKLHGGLILQWGIVPSIAANTNQAITFPIVFPNACFSPIVGSTGLTGLANGPTAKLYSYNATQIVIQNMEDSAVTNFSWFAIGC